MDTAVSLRIDLLASGATEPPAEVRLFKMGENATSKGTFTLDAAGSASCAASFARLGRELHFDYEHAGLAPLALDPAESSKAAGWWRLACRPDGAYATGIRWTPRARERIVAREFRYVSPVLRVDGRRIVEILGAAITNTPATLSPEPLMLSSGGVSAPAPVEDAYLFRFCRDAGLVLPQLVDADDNSYLREFCRDAEQRLAAARAATEGGAR